MLYINKNNLTKLNLDKMYVMADFNKTFTKGNSKTTWSIFASSNLFDDNYTKERNELFEIYKPFEDDETLDEEIKKKKLSEWWKKHIDLFPKYKLKEELIKKALEEDNIMELRDGVKEFLTFLSNNNIPLIIVSQGLGNFAKVFLEMNECYFDNIYISSNMIKFENGIAINNEGNITHNFNKSEIKVPNSILNKLQDKNQVLLLGDEISDLKILEFTKGTENLTVGFLTKKHEHELDRYNKYFDIVCSDNTSYNEIGKLLFDNYIKAE